MAGGWGVGWGELSVGAIALWALGLKFLGAAVTRVAENKDMTLEQRMSQMEANYGTLVSGFGEFMRRDRK
jgi:hypothetical protein